MNWIDSLLGIAILAIVPFILAAYGGHVAAQALTDPSQRRTAKGIFWGLCLLGIVVAIVYQFRVAKIDEERQIKAAVADEERQRRTDAAQQEALQAQADLKAIEKSNGEQVLWLKRRLDAVISGARSQGQGNAALALRNDLAAMAETMKGQTGARPQTAPSTPLVTQPPPSKPCRGDRLSECLDEEILEWGKPLFGRMSAIVDVHMAGLKALDDIKGGSRLSFLTGQDKDSRWLKAYAESQEKAADQFRDCCAENALRYQKELAQRVGGGLEKKDLYEWIERLLKPVKSKEWKDARREGGSKVLDIEVDLRTLWNTFGAKVRMAKLK
jgi:hypothetical protein